MCYKICCTDFINRDFMCVILFLMLEIEYSYRKFEILVKSIFSIETNDVNANFKSLPMK